MQELLVPRERLTGRNGWRQRRRAWYAPDFLAASIQDIDCAVLRGKGVRCLALDVDNTLVRHGGITMAADAIAFIRAQRERGLIERLALATNRPFHNLGPLAASMHADTVVYARGWQRKPSQRYFQRLVRELGCAPAATAMIGDKIWTDIYGANRAGLVTVLVEPLGPQAWFDWLLLHRWRQRRVLRQLTGRQ